MTRKKEEIPLRKMTEPQGHEPLAQEKCDHWRKPECQGQGSTLASSNHLCGLTLYWLCDSSRNI